MKLHTTESESDTNLAILIFNFFNLIFSEIVGIYDHVDNIKNNISPLVFIALKTQNMIFTIFRMPDKPFVTPCDLSGGFHILVSRNSVLAEFPQQISQLCCWLHILPVYSMLICSLRVAGKSGFHSKKMTLCCPLSLRVCMGTLHHNTGPWLDGYSVATGGFCFPLRAGRILSACMKGERFSQIEV